MSYTILKIKLLAKIGFFYFTNEVFYIDIIFNLAIYSILRQLVTDN